MKLFIISLLIFLIVIQNSIFVSAEESIVPSWVKNNAGWWAQDKIADSDFLEGIKFLIDEEIIIIPQVTPITTSQSSELIPSWVKNNAGYWSNGLIEESEFVSSIQFLIENGIISINQKFDNQSINFAITGDLAVNDATMKNLKNIELVNPEAILFVGDLRNDNGPPQGWFEMTEFLGKDRIHVALGNHDVDGDETEQYLNYYGLENEFYSFDYENVHFIVLATDSVIFIGTEQFAFLANDLAKSRQDPNIDWIIVGLHRSIYSDGPHNNKISDFTPLVIENDLYWRTVLQPLFDYYKVDLVLQGHNQFYERFYPLKFNEVVTDEESSNYVDPEGQLYVTIGTGGHRLDTPVKKSDTSVFQTNEFFGFLNLELSSDGKTMSGKFFNLDMDVIDEFQITHQKKFQLDQNDLSKIDLVGKDLTSADLTRVDLSGQDLSNVIFRNADLTYADLSYSRLFGADLRGANMHGVELEGVNLSGLDLTGANLSLVNLWGSDLSNVVLDKTTLYNTILTETDLSGKNLAGLNLQLADLRAVDFTNTDLSNANLRGSFYHSTIFDNTNLRGADLSNTHFVISDFTNSHMSGVNFANSILYLVDFSNMDLSDVNFSGTVMPGSILKNIDFRQVDLTNVDFSGKIYNDRELIGTDLTNVDLSNKDLRQTIFSRIAPFSKILEENYSVVETFTANLSFANLSGSNLSGKNIGSIDSLAGVSFRGANLSNANLSESGFWLANLEGANLSNANLKGIDLTWANLDGANLTGANLEGAILDCLNHPICN